MPKPSCTVCLCLDPARLNKAIIRLVHRGPPVNDIFPRFTIACYLTLTNPSSGYHNLKMDKKSLHLITFTCEFGRYRYARPPFVAAPGGDTFQCQIVVIFKELLNVFGMADDILIVSYDAE